MNQPVDITPKPHLDCLVSVLKSLKKDDNKLNDKLSFICEQINLLSQQKNHYVYSVEFIILCSIIFNISPHAYRYMRSIIFFTMPHPNTLKNLCLKYNTHPLIEKNVTNFLHYIKEKVKSLQKEDKIVNLMIDEIHLKQYLDYKGGNVVGSAHDSVHAAKTAYVFMIQSLVTSYIDVVHILPINKIIAQTLHDYIKKIVLGLHKLGFNVICVSSDNNSINCKALSFFANPPKLEIVYSHPANSTAPLFFILDTVHIFKCIRNNWLNQKDQDQTICFPSLQKMETMSLASFQSVKKLYEVKANSLVKYGHTLNVKSVNPSNLERQNVRICIKCF